MLLATFTSIAGAAGFPDRRFPFLAETACDRMMLAPSIAAVAVWAAKEVEMLAGVAAKQYGWSNAEKEDASQDALLRMIEYSLPRFDRTVGSTLEAFLADHFRRALRNRQRVLRRERRDAAALQRNAGDLTRRQEADPVNAAIAAEIREAPERYLKPRDATVFRTLIAMQHATEQDLADALGYRSKYVMNKRLKRLFARLLVAAGRELATW